MPVRGKQFKFGDRFAGLSPELLGSLESFLAGLGDFSDLKGRKKGNQLVRGNIIRAGDLRRLLNFAPGKRIGGSGGVLLDRVLNALSPTKGFSGGNADGTFNLGRGLQDLLSDSEVSRFNSIASQRPNKVDSLFKGGRVNLPDIRRLWRETQNEKAKNFLRDILVRARHRGLG